MQSNLFNLSPWSWGEMGYFFHILLLLLWISVVRRCIFRCAQNGENYSVLWAMTLSNNLLETISSYDD